MPDNTLREEILMVLENMLLQHEHGQANASELPSVYADKIAYAIKNRLPKEQKPVDFDNYSGEPRGWFIGHDACLANVKQALDIESEGASK